MGGTAENRACAISHQHEIRDIDRHLARFVERMHREQPGRHAAFFSLFQRFFGCARLFAAGTECGDFGIILRQGAGQRMVSGNGAEAHPENRVMPGCINLKPVLGRFLLRRCAGCIGQREPDPHSFRPADPVALHQTDLVGPFGQFIKRGQQLFRVIGDLEEPLCQQAPLHQRARPPAAPVDHLFIGQHRIVDRVPVYRRFLAVNQPFLEEIEEHALFMPVIFRIASGKFPAPVNRQPHRLELSAHGVDILVSPGGGMHLPFHRRILGRHAERVPAHRMQDIEAARAFVARHDIAHRVIADMSHMDPPRRIGKHLKHIIFRPACGIGRVLLAGQKCIRGVPFRLPFRFNLFGVIAGHPPILLYLLCGLSTSDAEQS